MIPNHVNPQEQVVLHLTHAAIIVIHIPVAHLAQWQEDVVGVMTHNLVMIFPQALASSHTLVLLQTHHQSSHQNVDSTEVLLLVVCFL